MGFDASCCLGSLPGLKLWHPYYETCKVQDDRTLWAPMTCAFQSLVACISSRIALS